MATERESRTILTADDRTGGAFASFQRNIAQAQAGIGSMQAMLAGLAGGAVIGGFATLIKTSIDSADALNKMSQKTGIATAELSKLNYAAALSDVSAESLTKGIKGLSQEMVKASDATSLSAALFKQLGVDIRGGIEPALAKIADTFKVLPDGATKTALAVDLFGKAGQDLIPMLNQGSAGIEKLKEEAEKLGVVIGGDAAKAAEQFNDNLKAIHESTKRMGIAIVNEAAPAFAKMSEAIKDALINGGKWQALVETLGQTGRYFMGEYDTRAQVLSREIRKLNDEFFQLRTTLNDENPGDLTANSIFTFLSKDATATRINSVTQRMSELRAELTKLKAIDQGKADVKGLLGSVDAFGGGIIEDNLRGIKQRNEDAKKAAADTAAWNKKLREEDVKGWVAHAEAVFAEADKLNQDLAKISENHWKHEDKLRDEDLKGWVAYAQAVFDEADKENLALAKISSEYWKEQDRHRQDATQIQISEWNNLADHIVGAFGRGKDALKDFLRSMLELFAKKWILQIGAALTGSTALSATASTLGQGSAAGSALSGLGNLVGIGSGFGTLAGAGGSVLTGGTLGAIANGAEVFGASAASGSFSGMAAGGSQILAAAGPYVAFALAAYGLYKAFAQKAGGPKEGGSFTGMFNDIGALGTGSSPGWYGVNTANANVQQLVTATGLALGQSISRYGGNTSGFGIGLGYDADPRGTAQSRITSYLKDASGAQLFGNSGMEIGRGNEGVALQLEMSRLLVEGLKASNINEQIKALFTGFDTASATQASIDALIASAEELNGVLGMLATVTISGLTVDSLKAMQAAGESLSQTAARVTGSFASLQDLFSTDAEKMARDQQLIADAFASINVAVPDSIAGFKALIDSLDLSSESGRGLYNVLIATGPKFKQIQDSMTGMLGAVAQSVVETYNAFATVSANIPTYNPASGYTPGNSEARASLADQLRASLTSDASPYTLAQKYATAKAQFDANLTLAQGGNANAISASFGLFQNFTGLSRQVNASSGQYNTDYFGGLNALGALTAGSARPFTAADYTAGNAQVVQALNANFNAVAAQTAALIENASEINAETVALLERIANATEKPASPGALTSTTL